MEKLKNSKFLQIITSLLICCCLLITYYLLDDNVRIFTISKIAVILFAISLICNIGRLLYHAITGKKTHQIGANIIRLFKTSAFWWSIVSTALLMTYIFTNPCFLTLIDYHKLHKEPYGGIYAYYVVAKSGIGKEYTLPAEVHIGYSESTKTKHSISGDSEQNVYSDNYIINRIYFKNGGFLYFEDGVEFSAAGKTTSCVDQNGNDWAITLTDKYTKSDDIKEDSPFNKKDYVLYVAISTLALIQCILWFVFI